MQKHNAKIPIEIFIEERKINFEKQLEKKLKPKKGFLSLVKLLKENNFKLSLSSNRRIDHVHLVVRNLDATDYFNAIVGPSPTLKIKPAPDIYLETAKQLQVPPQDCVVIEDSEVGVIAGKSAKMKVIAVPNKYTKHHDFSKADKIVKSLKDINPHLINTI